MQYVYRYSPTVLSPRALQWVREKLGPDAEPLLEELHESPGIPETITFPATLWDTTITSLVYLGISESDARAWQREVNAEAESLGRELAQASEARKRANREAQRRYREAHGDEYRARQREYTRQWRERRNAG